ncbi:MAG TPA: endonuclease III [Candidatus Limnocylindria bacterium]|nr:endonuclease III [Candidatus Limnocylindria bacterium]
MRNLAGLDQLERAVKIIGILRQATHGMVEPASNQIVARYGRDPFLVLISCLLSLRTKDTVSLPASLNLFERARTPQELLKLPLQTIEKIIYKTGFYRAKARTLHKVSAQLIHDFGGTVPQTEAELLSLPGVGRKTANLVLGVAFQIPAICVDTHVHRISNRLGLVTTTTPEQTEIALKKLLPPDYWTEYNRLLVMWGQNICAPLSPWCSRCAIADLCPKVGVTRQR